MRIVKYCEYMCEFGDNIEIIYYSYVCMRVRVRVRMYACMCVRAFQFISTTHACVCMNAQIVIKILPNKQISRNIFKLYLYELRY